MNKNIKYSQNFLTSEKVLNQIIKQLNLKETDTVYEIGTGKGHLTTKLAKISKQVTSIELDSHLFNFRGAKHFHTAAPMGWRCESAFALLSHQKVTKRLFLAEIYDKIEDGRISGKGAILWELRFRV